MNILKKIQQGIEITPVEQSRIKRAITQKTFKYKRCVSVKTDNTHISKIPKVEAPLCACSDCRLQPTILIRVYSNKNDENLRNYRCAHDNFRYIMQPDKSLKLYRKPTSTNKWDECMWRD